MTWLLVEDDTDIRNVISVMMTVWGEKPLVFPDGNAAWAWLDSVENDSFQGELPELALMDIRMPGHWGDKIAARIRQTKGLTHIPIILMTAFTLSQTEVNAMKEQAGIDFLVNKPLPDLDVFRTMLYEVRDKRRAHAVSSIIPAIPAEIAGERERELEHKRTTNSHSTTSDNEGKINNTTNSSDKDSSSRSA